MSISIKNTPATPGTVKPAPVTLASIIIGAWVRADATVDAFAASQAPSLAKLAADRAKADATALRTVLDAFAGQSAPLTADDWKADHAPIWKAHYDKSNPDSASALTSQAKLFCLAASNGMEPMKDAAGEITESRSAYRARARQWLEEAGVIPPHGNAAKPHLSKDAREHFKETGETAKSADAFLEACGGNADFADAALFMAKGDTPYARQIAYAFLVQEVLTRQRIGEVCNPKTSRGVTSPAPKSKFA